MARRKKNSGNTLSSNTEAVATTTAGEDSTRDVVNNKVGSKIKIRRRLSPKDYRNHADRMEGVNVNTPTKLVIPDNMGLSIPNFRRFNDSDEETNIPLGIIWGHYTPVGQESNEFYPTLAEYYLSSIRTSLKNAGYSQVFTNAQVRTYFTQISRILQSYKFVHDMRSLSKTLKVHTSPVISTVTGQSINGKLVANHRNVAQLLSNIPYPTLWKDVMWDSLGVTTISDNPNSGIRMFGPKGMQSDDGSPLDVTTILKELKGSVDDFYADDTSVLLSTVLQNVLPVLGDLPEFTDRPQKYVNDVVNNILNLAYFDITGPVYSPYYGDTDTVPLFFRRELSSRGCLTFVPDNNILVTPQSTVWSQTLSALETAFARDAFDNAGNAVRIVSDANLWLNFGSVWEATITLNAGRSPSITRVNATFEGVATGVGDMMFCS